MKKYISVLELMIRQKLYKVLLIILLMAAVQVAGYYALGCAGDASFEVCF
ncbi:MAG: hypothetical protein HUJ80_04900, partial [Firmicutes bacterium]|nr:hypothetical protein [Bacillota bacterium]